MVEYENKKKKKYEPISQWVIRDNGNILGIKDLYLIPTCESDYWIKKVKNVYEVYEPYLKEMEIKCNSMDEALEYIKDITKIRKRLETWYKVD